MDLGKTKGLLGTTPTAASGPLTLEMLAKAVRAIENAPPHPCRLGQHILTKRELDRGYGMCGNCGAGVGRWPVPR